MTTNESINIRIMGNLETISKATNIELSKLNEELERLRQKDILDYDENLIRIHSRRDLINLVID